MAASTFSINQIITGKIRFDLTCAYYSIEVQAIFATYNGFCVLVGCSASYVHMEQQASAGVTQIATAAHIVITRKAVIAVVVTLAVINEDTKHYFMGVLEFKTFA